MKELVGTVHAMRFLLFLNLVIEPKTTSRLMTSVFEPVVEDVPVGLVEAGGWVGGLVGGRPPEERATDKAARPRGGQLPSWTST